MMAAVEGVVVEVGNRVSGVRRTKCFSQKTLRRVVEAEYRADPALRADMMRASLARPKTRGECVDGPRPCPFASCRYHLGYDVTRAGSMLVMFPGRALDDLPATCALDVADEGGVTLEEVARVMNLVRERVRQLQDRILWNLRREIDP